MMGRAKKEERDSKLSSVVDSIKYGMKHPFGLGTGKKSVVEQYASGISDKEKAAEAKQTK